MAEGLVGFGAGFALVGDLPVGLRVLYLPALPDERAGESGHLGVGGGVGTRGGRLALAFAFRRWGGGAGLRSAAAPLPGLPGRRDGGGARTDGGGAHS